MARVKMMAVALEDVRQLANEFCANCCHFNRLAPFGYQGAHARIAQGIAVNQPSHAHGWANVDESTVESNPIRHGNAECDKLAGPSPEPVPGRANLAANFQGIQRPVDRHFQPFKILAHCPAAIGKGNNGVDGKLAGAVNQAISAPLDPANFHLPFLKWSGAVLDVSGRTGAAHGDHLGVLTKQHADPPVTPIGRFRNQFPLQGHATFQLDLSEQEGFEEGIV